MLRRIENERHYYKTNFRDFLTFISLGPGGLDPLIWALSKAFTINFYIMQLTVLM